MAKTMIENSAATAPAPVLPGGKLIDVYVVPKDGAWLVRVRGVSAAPTRPATRRSTPL
jgi:hypothetical protein